MPKAHMSTFKVGTSSFTTSGAKTHGYVRPANAEICCYYSAVSFFERPKSVILSTLNPLG